MEAVGIKTAKYYTEDLELEIASVWSSDQTRHKKRVQINYHGKKNWGQR